ncbi:hypothetical protein DYB26_008864 [Aphanomyces astaci]|uniref:Uncharacterized protein n=1 Tax=Aphanomyces astaci TaxID=112090 RepID=A0A418E3L5_APHAT|nr:hypothetical protein DYB26_008864 [Aphanomyces astaci]
MTEYLADHIAFGNEGFHVIKLGDVREENGEYQALFYWLGLDEDETSLEPVRFLYEDIPIVFRRWVHQHKTKNKSRKWPRNSRSPSDTPFRGSILHGAAERPMSLFRGQLRPIAHSLAVDAAVASLGGSIDHMRMWPVAGLRRSEADPAVVGSVCLAPVEVAWLDALAIVVRLSVGMSSWSVAALLMLQDPCHRLQLDRTRAIDRCITKVNSAGPIELADVSYVCNHRTPFTSS